MVDSLNTTHVNTEDTEEHSRGSITMQGQTVKSMEQLYSELQKHMTMRPMVM